MSAVAANTKVALLLLGVLIGGTAGWLTRPAPADIRLGGTSVAVTDALTPAGAPEPTTDRQGEHVILYTLAGGIIGLLTGFAVDRRR